MPNQVILSANGPAIRVEIWRDMRCVETYTVPALEPWLVDIVNAHAGIALQLKLKGAH